MKLPKRMNFRQLVKVGFDPKLINRFTCQIYFIGCRGNRVYYAHGAADLKAKRAYPVWLLHGQWRRASVTSARALVERKIQEFLRDEWTILRRPQRAWFRFEGGRFRYQRIDGHRRWSTRKVLRSGVG